MGVCQYAIKTLELFGDYVKQLPVQILFLIIEEQPEVRGRNAAPGVKRYHHETYDALFYYLQPQRLRDRVTKSVTVQ